MPLPLEAPRGNDATSLADWAETLLLLEDDRDGLTRGRLERLLDDEPERLEDPGQDGAEVEVQSLEEDIRLDRRVELLLREVGRRQTVAPRVYGYVVEERTIFFASVTEPSIYALLLWLSLPKTPFRHDDRETEVEEAFDDLCRAAVLVLLGPDAQAVLFARRYAEDPSTESVRPTAFPEAVLWLRRHLTLEAGQFPVPDGPPPDYEGDLPLRTYSDGGVDVVAWRAFRDLRAGFPLLLVQATIQMDWRPKTNDINLALWGDWIRFVTPPQRALSIPFAVAHGKSWWRDRNRMAGLVLDRLRLCELLDYLSDDDLSGLIAGGFGDWLRRERQIYLESRA